MSRNKQRETERDAISQALVESRGRRKNRRCHDCGKPTSDYRCAACWAKRRGIRATTQDLADQRRVDGNFVYA